MGKTAARAKNQGRYLSQEPRILQLFRSGAAKDWFKPGRERPRVLKLAAHLLRACREGNFAINGRRMGQQWAGSGCAANAPDEANLGATLLPEIAFGHNGTAARWSTTQRKLAAVLFADIAGYTRLMDMYEAETHHRLITMFDEIVDPAIAATGGCVVKNTGDGFLARFESVTNAVECAVGIQQSVNRREGSQPAAKRLVFRMGLHVADVIIEPRDVYGAGVNIAARLQEFAEPGSIAISASVREQLETNLKLMTVDLGEVTLKNLAEPMHAFRLLVSGGAESECMAGVCDSPIGTNLMEDLIAELAPSPDSLSSPQFDVNVSGDTHQSSGDLISWALPETNGAFPANLAACATAAAMAAKGQIRPIADACVNGKVAPILVLRESSIEVPA